MVHLDLKRLLKENNKTPYFLVQGLNSNYTMVNKMINNETKSIEYETIEKLLKLFNCTIDDLFVVKK